MYSVGEVIRQARHQRGWGQRRLAEVSGVSQPNIAAIETGARVPSLAMVGRLVRACALQVRYDLEPLHADVDTEIAALLEREPMGRLAVVGLDAMITASRLAMVGMRLVLDGALAARLSGAPVVDRPERIWCRYADLDQLRAAVLRCHLDLRPVRPRYSGDDDLRPVLAEGDEVRVGRCRITLGVPPPAPWSIDMHGKPFPVVSLDTLLADRRWVPPDRVAVQRLAEALADRGEAAHGLDKAR